MAAPVNAAMKQPYFREDSNPWPEFVWPFSHELKLPFLRRFAVNVPARGPREPCSPWTFELAMQACMATFIYEYTRDFSFWTALLA